MPPTSIPSVTVTDMELTPCQVFYQGPAATAEVDLGGTLGNVIVSAKYMKAEIKADQLGETVLDRRVSGTEIMVTTELNQIKDKDIWKVVFPHATLIDTGAKAIQFNSNVGDSDLGNAGILRLHPQSVPSGTVDFDHTFFKAVANSESEFVMSPTEQSKLKIVWNILPDTSVTGQPRFYRYGDTTLV